MSRNLSLMVETEKYFRLQNPFNLPSLDLGYVLRSG